MTEEVCGYLLDIEEATRQEQAAVTPVSVRGTRALYAAAQVTALFAGRDYAVPEDVKYVAPYVLLHRIAAGVDAGSGRAEKFLADLLAGVQVPLEGKV